MWGKGSYWGAPRAGRRSLGGGGPPPVTWYVDPTSGLSFPQDDSGWTDFFAANSGTLSAWSKPDHQHTCQEPSGNAAAVTGGLTLTANGSPGYQQAIAGWTLAGLKGDGATSNQRFLNVSGPNPSTTDVLTMALVGIGTLDTTARAIFSSGGTAQVLAQVVTGTPRLIHRSNTTSSIAAGDYSAGAYVIVGKWDSTNSERGLYTNLEAYEPSWVAPASSASYGLGGFGAAVTWASAAVGGLVTWTGAKARRSSAEIKALLVAMGVSVPWWTMPFNITYRPPGVVSFSVDGITITGSGTEEDPYVASGAAGEPGVFSVVTYGADATGVSDSTAGVQAAIDAAVAEVTASGRHQVVYFPAGTYVFSTKAATRQFDIYNLSKLIFLGAPGKRSRLIANGDAGGGDWYMFCVREGSTNIEFRELWLDMTGITNPDPAEQNHLIQLGQGCSDVRVIDCEFNYAPGDGIRLLGEFGKAVRGIKVINCRFINCTRSGMSAQRWVQNATVAFNTFYNGTDQQIDFEPTGYTLTADAGSGATTLVDAVASFITWGIAHNDLVYNSVEDVYCRVVSVDSATQLTVTAGCTDWTGDGYQFPKHNSGHLFFGNRLYRGTNPNDILLTLTGTYQTRVEDNYIEGCVQGVDVTHTNFERNNVITPVNNVGTTAVQFIKACDGLTIKGNRVVLNSATQSTTRGGITVGYQIRQPHGVRIQGNEIYANCRTTAIGLLGVRDAYVEGNEVILNTPGETTQSVAIYFNAAISMNILSAVALGNKIRAEAGQWVYGVWMSANASSSASSIGSAIVGGGYIRNCSSQAIRLTEDNGGTFTNPVVLVPTLNDVGEITPPAGVPWLVIGGVGGAAPTTNSRKPAIFWGTGSPEGVLTAGVGSQALRRDGGTGTTLYIKESGTGNTGWVPK